MAKTNFSGPVVSKNGFVGMVTLDKFNSVAELDPEAYEGTLIYVSTDDESYVAFSNGAEWVKLTGSNVVEPTDPEEPETEE